MDIKKKIKFIPDRCGVYLFKDKRGDIIYVGKATSLKKRILSYFGKQVSLSKQETMLSKAKDFEYLLTGTEAEALILESNLIKKNRPKYNVALKDDKNYPLLKIEDGDFPSLKIVRRKAKSGLRYFGPYTNAKLLRSALKTLRQIFPYRTCRNFPNPTRIGLTIPSKEGPKKPCLDYFIGICPAPCAGRITKKEYKKNINNLCLFLNGHNDKLFMNMSKQMELYAKRHDFEKAKDLRDRSTALNSMLMGKNPVGLTDSIGSNSSFEGIVRPILVGFGPSLDGIGKAYPSGLEELRVVLNLKNIPYRIEAFDISSISGNCVVGSMVSFYKGVPDKNNYRRFRITAKDTDDCSAISEIIKRRYRRVVSSEVSAPDLIIIDGGRGQLNSAVCQLKALKLKISIISIAKKKEQVYSPGKNKPLRINKNSQSLHLICRIRDEAHRFAHKYHTFLRKKRLIPMIK